MNKFEIESTSRHTAKATDIILRETTATRLIFRPLLVDNSNDSKACIRGDFIFQRKNLSDSWEDYKELNLSDLKAKEWVKVELKSSEVLTLFEALDGLYELYRQEGITRGQREFVSIDSGLLSLLETTEANFNDLLNKYPNKGVNLLNRLLNWCNKINLPEQLSDELPFLNITQLQEINVVTGLATLKNSLKIWQENQSVSSEEFWQNTFSEYSFVLSQIFTHPVVIIQEKAFVSGKSIDNKGGNITDFLAQNNVSKNTVLIEIKTPNSKLLGTKYRNVYQISGELSGAITQVANYKYQLTTDLYRLKHTSSKDFEFESLEPDCIVIIGNYLTEISNDRSKKESFELFRSHLRGIQILTYDEIFEKVKMLIELLEGNSIKNMQIIDDEPF